MPQNVLGTPLEACCYEPATGFYRDGFCRTGGDDVGNHTVCAQMTKAFLAYTKAQGNDLSTPMPAYQFPGLNEGDWWCLCVERWAQALEVGVAPPVKLKSTHLSALEFVSLDDLKSHAVDGA